LPGGYSRLGLELPRGHEYEVRLTLDRLPSNLNIEDFTAELRLAGMAL
jgi:hypothetical protein